jgi:hypothetical protein
MSIAVLGAQTWRGDGLSAAYEVTIDDQAVEVDRDGLAPTFRVPDGASSIVVKATPSSDAFWPNEAEFTIAGDGSITSDDEGQAKTNSMAAFGARLTVLAVKLWRLRDVSAKIRDLLEPAARPKLRLGKKAEDLKMFEGEDYPPPTWTLFDRDNIRFIGPGSPLAAKQVVTDEPKTATFVGTSLVLELAGVKAPRLLAVSWPASVPREDLAAPAPFLVFFRPGVGQEVRNGFYSGVNTTPPLEPYPFNHDYAYYALYQYLWYRGDPFTWDSGPKGMPYQIADAGKDIVTILPCNAVGPEFGAFMDAASAREILLEIQAFMFAHASVAKPPEKLGRLAFGAFSSGNGFLAQLLSSPKNRADTLLRDVLKEVYLFDPPRTLVDGVIAAALAWAGDPANDRRIVTYSQFAHPAHARLLGGAGSWPATPSLNTTVDARRMVGVIDVATWKTSIEAVTGSPWPVAFDWRNAHQLIPSMLLKHAVATSGF